MLEKPDSATERQPTQKLLVVSHHSPQSRFIAVQFLFAEVAVQQGKAREWECRDPGNPTGTPTFFSVNSFLCSWEELGNRKI